MSNEKPLPKMNALPRNLIDLRDEFAMRAMQGIVAGVSSLSKYDEDRVRKDWQKSYPGMTWGQAAAEQSYHIADAMLEARKK